MKNKITAVILLTLCISTLSACGNDPAGSTPETIVPRLSVKHITLSNGVKLEYAEQGLATGTPVIFIHGFTDSWHSFQSVLPHLPSSVHAYAISLRGHGDSDRPLEGYATADFAADIADFIKQLKIGPAIIVGHSMGGIIAQRLVLDHPQLVKALVIGSSSPLFVKNEGSEGMMAALNSFTTPNVDSSFARQFQESTIVKPVDKTYVDTLVAESCKVPTHVWKAAFTTTIMATNYVDDLKKITQPVLIVWGDKDVICVRHDQDLFTSNIKQAKLVVYNGTGHSLHWEEPARFANDLLAFGQVNGLIAK
jgi:non-heme chloroperoxidase